MTLYAEYVRDCRQGRLALLSLSTIQGDIKPLIHHLQFAGRFRRSDLVSVLDRFHKLKSRLAPAVPDYRPREANFLADYLAGEASKSLRGLPNQPTCQMARLGRLDVALPYELLLTNQAVVLGEHQSGRVVLALREVLSCSLLLLEKYAVGINDRQGTLLRQLLMATAKLTRALCVEYIGSAEDGLGRLCARQVSAQSLSREARSLIYGSTHREVDISGAHYEILRHTSGEASLPSIMRLRDMISLDCQGSGEEFASFVKLLPLRLLNTGTEQVLSYVTTQGYQLSASTIAVFRTVEALRDIHTPKILCTHRNDLKVSFRNRNYHSCETIESQFMQTFYRNLCVREQLISAIWLHVPDWRPEAPDAPEPYGLCQQSSRRWRVQESKGSVQSLAGSWNHPSAPCMSAWIVQKLSLLNLSSGLVGWGVGACASVVTSGKRRCRSLKVGDQLFPASYSSGCWSGSSSIASSQIHHRISSCREMGHQSCKCCALLRNSSKQWVSWPHRTWRSRIVGLVSFLHCSCLGWLEPCCSRPVGRSQEAPQLRHSRTIRCDGMWVNQEVSDESIRFAEREALNTVFPGFRSILRIVSLAPRYLDVVSRLSSPGSPGNYLYI